MAADKTLNFGCKPALFFKAVFADDVDADCSQDEVAAFKKVFILGQDAGKWLGDRLTIYHSVGASQSFLFAFDGSGRTIKIDTDFLSKDELKAVVNGAL